MWATILSILNGALDVASRFLSAWHDSQERQAGRNEEQLQNAREAVNAMRKADEIDRRPSITDRVELLKRLRAEPRGYYLGSPDRTP